MENETLEGWITLFDKPASDLERLLDKRKGERIAAGAYSEDDVQYISKVSLQVTNDTLSVTPKLLEQLRLLCQLWDIDFRAREISSHRPFVGPLIVAAKRVLYPILKVFLKDLIRQQRSFNAGVIALLAELSNQQASGLKEERRGCA